MPNDNLKKLWTNVSNEYELPDIATFEKDMQDETKRKKLWSAIAKDYDLPEFEQFSDDMGFKKKVPTKLQPQQTPSQTSSTASVPPLGQKPKQSESVTPSTSKPADLKTNGYAITTPDSVESGDNLATVKSQDEKAREKALADQAERLRIQEKYHDTVLNWEKQPKEKDRTGGLKIKSKDGKAEVGSVFDEKANMLNQPGSPSAPVQMYDADFSEYMKRTNRFRDQVGSITANKINNDNVAWINTELPKILKQDSEYIASEKELKAAHTQLQQLVARGEMPIEEAKAQLAKLSEQFNASTNAIAAKYYKERENKSKEEFQKLYAEELQRSAKKIKGPEYYAAMTEVFKSQAFKGLSIDDKKEWIRQAWKKEEQNISGDSKYREDLYDEFMRNMVHAVSYDEKGNPTSYALKEMAAEKIAKLNADYTNYINTHPDRYGAADMSIASAKSGNPTALDPITEQYQRSIKMLQDVISAPNETQEIGFEDNLKAGNLSMLWDGMKSKPPLPFIRPLDELVSSTTQSAIAKKDPNLWSESERAFMDGVAIKEIFDRTAQSNPWYSMGQGLSGSLEYVGEFLATGGVYSGVGGATERAALKMLKIPSRTIEKGVTTAAENLTSAQALRYWSVGRPLKFLLASAAQTAANPQRYLNGIVQRMSPGVELALSEDGDELVAALDKNYKTPEGYRTGHNQGALEATARSFGETWSEMGTERMGDGVNWLSSQMARGALKGVKSVDLLKRLYIGYYMSKFGLNKTAMMSKIISDKLGWHGFVPELAEEIVNMPLSNIATGEAPVMQGIIKDTGEIDWDNLLETAGVVLLQSPIMNSPHMVASAANYIGEKIKDPMRMAVYDENGYASQVEVSANVLELVKQARSKDFKSLVKLKEEEIPKMKLTPDERAVAGRLIDSIIYEATDPTAFDDEIKSLETQLAKPEIEGGKRKMYEEGLAALKQKKKEAERAGEKRKDYAANANTLTKQLREFDSQLKNQLQKVANVARQPDIEDEENAGDFAKAEKVSMKMFNGDALDDNDKAIAAIYPKLIQSLSDIETERKASIGLEKTKTDFNEADFNKSFDQRKAQMLGTVEKQPKQDKNRLKWAGKLLKFNPEILEALMALTPKGYQEEAMKQLAGEFGIEGPVTSVAEFIMRLDETTLFSDEGADKNTLTEQKGENKQVEIPVSTLKNKPVVFKKRRGVLTIDEGGKVTIETPTKIFELEAGPDSDANEFGIDEVKVLDDDFKITDVTEETVTVNGESYRIKTDKKGSITRLIGKKDIKDEETLAAVESERNKLPLPEVVKKQIEVNPVSVIEAVGEVVGMTPVELKAIERILDLNMNDDVAEALDKMLEGESLPDPMYYKVMLWAEDAVNRLEKAKADIPNGADYLESLIDNIYNILNEIPDGKITDKQTESSGEVNDQSPEPGAEEGDSSEDGEEIEPEPEGTYGKSGKALTTADEAIEFTYKLIEADDLQPSHLVGGERNPNHLISAAQPKERNDKGSRDAQDKIAANPEMSRLGQNENIYFGAPVVNSRNEVIQGNNRSIGLKKHYSKSAFPLDGDFAYRVALSESAEQFGFTKDQVLSMRKPVLVREVDVTDDEAIVMGQRDVKDLESGGKQRIDPITLSRKISQQDKAKISSIVFAEDKTLNAAIRDNIEKLAPILNSYINAAQFQTAYNENGELTEKGASDFTEAISHFLFFGGPAVLPSAFEELSAKTKLGLQKALAMIFGVPEQASLLPEIQNAILILYKYHASNVSSFENWAKTNDMFTGDMPINIFTPLELVMAEMIDTAPSQVAIKNIFGAYANLVNGTAGDMFTPKVEGIEKEEAINQVFFNNKAPKYGKGQGQKPSGKGKPDNKEPKEKPAEKPEKPKSEKRKLRDEAAQKEADDAWDDLLNLGVADSPEQQVKRFEAANKILAVYFKKGIYKLTDILEDGAVKLGEKLRDLFETIKDVYLAYQNRATDEELDKMQTPREVRAINIDEILKQQQDESESLEPGSGQGSNGNESGKSDDAELPPTDSGEGGVDAGGNGEINEGGSKGGRGSGASVGGVRQPSIVGNYNLGEAAKSPEVFNVSERYDDNLEALSILLDLLMARKQATKAQQAKLAKYVGYGGLKEILLNPDSEEGWTPSTTKYRIQVKRTKILVDAIEASLKSQGKAPEFSMWQFLRESTDTSFYTPYDLVHGMYYALDKLGFKHGKVLEPSAGIGNFFIGMPKSVSKNSMLHAVELDYITGNILKQLFPDAFTHLGSYEYLAENHNNYDVVVTNVPFSNKVKIKGLSIHNYFFRQALDNVREGGVIAFITSTGTMDSMDKTTREYIEENGYFLGAVRVGDKAFKASNTSVTSDIIFIQKKGSGVKKPKIEKAFTETVERLDENGDTYRINEYFNNNPESILGTLKPSTFIRSSGMYVESPSGINHEEAIKKWVDANLAKVYDHAMSIQEVADMELVQAEKEEFQKVNNLYRFDDGRVGHIHGFEDGKPLVMKGKFVRLSKDATKRVPAFIELRKAFNELVYLEYNGFADERVNEARSKLNRAYDKFFSQFGPLSAKDNVWMELDIDGYNVRSLENKDDNGKITKADIFFQRTIKANKPIDKADTLEEAIIISYAEKAEIDPELIEKLLGLQQGEWANIDKRGLVFFDPGHEKWVARDEYLSGNVKRKLREAKTAKNAKNDPNARGTWLGDTDFTPNIVALEEVQPALASASGIFTPMGARWIPEKYYEEFFEYLFDQKGKVNYYKSGDNWDVLFIGRAGVKMNSYEVTAPNVFSGEDERYGSPVSLFELAINGSEPTFYDTRRTDAGTDRRLNQVATDRGINIYNRIRKEFNNWIYKDDKRRDELVDLYNEHYNDIVLRKYDGSSLQTPGLTHYTLAQHQKDAVWMLLHLRGGIIDHEVGLGKSLVIIAAAMEMRRLNIARKPMAIGLKSQLPGMVDEFRKAYPHAKILSLTNDNDFSAKNRKRILSKIASNDWDLVAITHDNFNAISHDKSFQIEVIQEELDAMETELRKLSGDSKRFESDLNDKIRKLRAKLTLLANNKTDDEILTFQQLGVDMLFVDESQKFKNLEFQSKLQNIKGLGNQEGSMKAFNMLIASKSLHKSRGSDEGLVFLSGTPISNSLSEMYLLMKYMRPTILKEKEINTFDTWAALFAESKKEYELYMGKLKEINRFRKFGNAPELLKMYREIADVKNSTNTVIDRPEGVHKLEVVKMTPMQKAWLRELQDFIGEKGRYGGEWISDSPNAQKAYSVVAVTSAKLMSIDMRLVLKEPEIIEWMKDRGLDPNETFGYGDKISKVADNVSEIYKRTDEHKGVQLLFCDVGTPKSKNTVENLYNLLEQTETEENMERIFGKIGQEFEDLEKKPSVAGIRKNIIEVLGFTNEDVDLLITESAKMTFDSYGEIKKKLMDRGIPENQIAFIHSWNGSAKRKELYAKVNNGEIRVLIGSTEKMGVGVNVQKRAIAAHHIDIKWTPADLEQRNGRIIRQRNWYAKEHNDNKVEIYYYALDQSLDAYMYNIVATKANWIKQAKTSNMTERYIEDIDNDADMASMAAVISGNQTLKERIRLERELAQLEEEKIWIESQRMDAQAAIKRRLEWIEQRIETIKTLQEYQAFYEKNYPKVERTTVGEKGMELVYNHPMFSNWESAAKLYEEYKKSQQKIKDRQVKEGENDIEFVEEIENTYQAIRQEESVKDEAKYEVTLMTKDGDKTYTSAKEAGEAFLKYGLNRAVGHVGTAYGFSLYVKRDINSGDFAIETHHNGIPVGQPFALPAMNKQLDMMDGESNIEGQYVQLGKLLRAGVLGIKHSIKSANSDIDIYKKQISDYQDKLKTLEFDPEKQALIDEIHQRLEEVIELFKQEEAEENEREEREREARKKRRQEDAAQLTKKAKLQSAVDNENNTVSDIANEIESLEIDELQSALEDYREEERYNRELGGRGDMDSANDGLMAAVNRYLNDIQDEEGMEAPTEKQTIASSILDKLERLKIDTSGRQTYALPFPPQLWNGFVSAIQVGVKAGERLVFAINRGIAYLKENNVKNIDDYVKQIHEVSGIPYVPGNPFQPNLDRPLFDRSIDAQDYIDQNYISGFEPRPINGQFTIAPIGEKSLAERINEMGEVSLAAVLHKLLPLGYSQTEIEVMYDVVLNDLVATLNKRHQNQNLGVLYGEVDRSQPDGPDYFKSKFIRPILFRGIKSGIRPFTVSQRIRDLFIKELGFDIQEKMLRNRYLGVYKHQSKRVRVQSLRNVIVAAHEGMHAIDFNESTPISTQVASLTLKHPLVKELEKIYLEFYPTAKASAPTRTKIVEGMAVLIERYCQDPIDILKRYPLLVSEFIDPAGMFYVPKTKVLIDGINSMIQDYASLPKDSMRMATAMSQVANEKNPLWYKNVATSDFRRAMSKLKFFLFNTLEPARFIDQIAGTSYTNNSFESVLAARRRLYGIIDPWIHGKAPAIIYDGHGNYTEVGNLSIASMLKGLSEEEIILLNSYLIARRGMDDLNNMNIADNIATKAHEDYKDEEAILNSLYQQFGTDITKWTTAQRNVIVAQSEKTTAYLNDYNNKKSEFHRLERLVVKDKFDLSAARGTVDEVELQPGDDAATRKNKMKILRAVDIYDNINQSLLDYAYNGGLIDRDKYIEWKNNKAYASFQRHITDDMNDQAAFGVSFGISKSVDAFRKREGSDLEIMMPVYSQISHINQVITNVHENLAWQALEKIALRDSEVGRMFEKHQATYHNQGGRMIAKEANDDTFVKVMHNGVASWYKISPELVAMRRTFNDNGFDFGYGIGYFFNAMGLLGRFTSRMITTAYPLFFLINLPVDTPSKFMNAPAGGKGAYRFLKYMPTSWSGAPVVLYNALTEQLLNTLGNTMLGRQVDWGEVNDKLTAAMPVGMQNLLSPVLNKLEKTAEQYRMYSSLGARAATMASTHMSPAQRLEHIKTINASVWKKLITFGPGYTSRLKESVESIVSIAEIPSNTSEYLIRFETYKQAKANGDNDMLAMFKAEQATVAFVQHGANPVVAALMRSIIFANAGMQVFYRYGSSWAHHPKRMAVVHSLFAAASVIMISALLDLPDDDKRLLDGMSLEEWGRYFTYKLPGDPEGKFRRLRIPDQLGFINMLTWYTMRNNKEVGDKETESAFKSAAAALSDVDFINASINLWLPNAVNLVPVLKKGGGVDVKNSAAKLMNTIPTFTKTSIEAGLGVRTYPKVAPLDSWMTGEDVEKYDKYTSELAKTMAGTFGGTPIQHDHFIRGTLGRSFQLVPWVGQNREVKNPLIYSGEGREFRGAYFNQFYESLQINQQSKESLMADLDKGGLTVMHKAIIDNYVAHLRDDNVKQLTFEEFRNKFPNSSEEELEKTWRRTNAYFDWLVQKDVADVISELRTFYKDFDKVPKNVPVALWKMIELSIADPRYNMNAIGEVIKNKLVTPEFGKELKDIVKSSISQIEEIK